jgi:hypothetical protein
MRLAHPRRERLGPLHERFQLGGGLARAIPATQDTVGLAQRLRELDVRRRPGGEHLVEAADSGLEIAEPVVQRPIHFTYSMGPNVRARESLGITYRERRASHDERRTVHVARRSLTMARASTWDRMHT